MEHQIVENDPKTGFLESVNAETSKSEITDYKENHVFKILESEINSQEIFIKLSSTEQEKIKVRTIIMDSRLDFINSAKKLQSVFQTELTTTINKLNEKFNSEIMKIKQLYRKELIGTGLIDLVNDVSEEGWVLVMKENSVNLYKCYNPAYPVNLGFYTSGAIREYEEPVTYLRGIYINILHPKITTGTIYLHTEGGTHPNCASKGFGAACPGTLQDREISVTDTDELIGLLHEVSMTYQKMHLDSAYYTPTKNYTERNETPQWTT
jgi:hypothetical protein